MSTKLNSIKVVIFDMDGVLFKSGASHEQAFRKTLLGIGIRKFSYPAVAGMRTDEALIKLLTENNYPFSQEDIKVLSVKKQVAARQALKQTGKLIPYARELLTALQTSFTLVLASSASQGTIDIFLEKLSLPDIFSLIMNGSAVQQAKPEPDIYQLAVDRLGVVPDECLVVEDAVSGILAARRANIKTIGVTGTEDAITLRQSGANWVATNLQEVESIVLSK